ncbi:FtsX-like permease family protein [Demequina globuliformis]|uniref:FtsX-like permease family protein n=1 Tax=Demequina globuliformis TaxID=676202 RepID=UPI000784C3A5|nr:FtsX-like permease family protein [Demequina globuliformis]
MSRLGAVIVGLVAAALGFASRSLLADHGPDGMVAIGMGFFAMSIYGPFLLTVIGGAVAAFRGIWLSTQRAELSSRMAMGATRRSLLTSEALTGLRDGAIAGAVGLAVGAGVRQGLTGFTGTYLDVGALSDWCAILLLSVACSTAGYWLAATWMTRGSVREVSTGLSAQAPAARAARAHRTAQGSPSPKSRRKRPWVLWSAIGLVVAAIACVRLVDGAPVSGFGALALGILVAVGIYLALPALLLYAGAIGGAHLVAWAATLLRRGAHGASARSIASDGLLRHTSMRAAALLAVAAVLALSTLFASMVSTSEARFELSDAAMPYGSISTVDISMVYDSLPGTPGWQQALPANLLDALEADDRLEVVRAGVLVTDERTFESRWDDTGSTVTTFDVLLAPTRDALRAAAPEAANALYFAPGIEWSGDGRVGVAQETPEGSRPSVTVNGLSVDVTKSWHMTPFAGVDRDWAEEHFGPTPTSAVLLYPASEGVSVAGVMSDYDTDGLFTTHDDLQPVTLDTLNPRILAGITAPFLAIAVCVVVALAWATQRTRAKDHATLIALGAQASALRGAAAIEAGVTTAAATLSGLATGAILATVLDLLFGTPLNVALVPLMVWNAGFVLAHVPWLTLAALAVAAVALAMLGALTIRIRMDRLSPAQQLAEAQKAGVS